MPKPGLFHQMAPKQNPKIPYLVSLYFDLSSTSDIVMNRDRMIRILKVFFIGFVFGSILYNRPGDGLDNLSYASGYFYFYIFVFVFLLVRWLK